MLGLFERDGNRTGNGKTVKSVATGRPRLRETRNKFIRTGRRGLQRTRAWTLKLIYS